MIKKHTFKCDIFPDKLICNSNFKNIIVTKSEYNIKEFCVYTDSEREDKIKEIYIFKGKHPNCDPKNKMFCIPDFLKNQILNKESMELILNMIKTFNINSAFFQPWADFEYDNTKYQPKNCYE